MGDLQTPRGLLMTVGHSQWESRSLCAPLCPCASNRSFLLPTPFSPAAAMIPVQLESPTLGGQFNLEVSNTTA